MLLKIKKDRIPNLDTLRFIAALLVIFQHIELYKSSFLLENIWNIPFTKLIGNIGVVLFFVLSGFLITSILLNEKETNKQIDFRKFYINRILRIWPLYYLILILGLFLLPFIPFFQVPENFTQLSQLSSERWFSNILIYLMGFSHWGRTLFGNIAYISQTWSLATEQLFYLLWPFVITYFNRKLMIILVFIVFFHHIFVYFLVSGYAFFVPYSSYLLSFISELHLHCMAVGSIFSVIVYRKSRLLKFIFNPLSFYFAITLVLLLVFLDTKLAVIDYDIYAVLFGIIISNLAFNTLYSKVLENKITNYLGSISYGIYMYHCVIIVVSIRLAIICRANWIVYPVTLAGTFLLAHLSYKYFESYFLRLSIKQKHSII